MQHELDSPVDYAALHTCHICEAKLRLQAFPVEGGWVAATVCQCRAKGGLPQRYSTETDVLATFDAAEVAISWLLHPPTVSPAPDRRCLYHRPDSDRWVVQVERRGSCFRASFRTEDEARKARDEFLEQAA